MKRTESTISSGREIAAPATKIRSSSGGVGSNEAENLASKISGARGLFVVALFGVALTFFASEAIYRTEHANGQLQSENRVQRVESIIKYRMDAYVQILRSGVAAFHADPEISRQDWQTFVSSLETTKLFPGIQGIGYSKWLRPDELDDHLVDIRTEGFINYRVWPEGERENYTAIVYLEPFDFRNRRAFGYDMFSEPTRRAAMARARDTGEPALTGRVILKQETKEDVQAGFLVYVPLYKNGWKTDTVDERRAALEGFVYSPFRMNDFMRGAYGPEKLDFALWIYDGTALAPDKLMYQGGEENEAATYTNTSTIEMYGNAWTLRLTSLPAFENSIHGGSVNIVRIAGLLITLLILATVRIMAMTGRRAMTIAERMTSALSESEKQFRQAFAIAPHGMAVVSLNGNWLMVNDALCRMTGYDESELLAKNIRDITHPDDFPRQLEYIRQMLAGEISTYQMEKKYIRSDGTLIPILLSVGLVRDGRGHPLHFISQTLDLTETKNAERQLWQAQKMEAVGQLTGGLAHDFNNLLAVILGNLQLLERHVEQDEKAKARASAAADAARRGAELTHRLLAFSRRQVLEAKVVDPVELIDGMGELLEGTLGEKIELEISSGTANWLTRIDPHQLETAILNLAVNARDAMSEGGHLTIETKPVTLEDRSFVGESDIAPGDYIALSVTDNGSGIPKELVDKVFQPFFTTKDVGKGTGLGLSMVYGFAKQSGGHVDIYTEPGMGTTITLYLPRERVGVSQLPADRTYPEEAPFGTESILVVEDNEAVLDVVGTMLEELGYTVYRAETGQAALLRLAAHEIDVLLTDIVMPGGMSGAELAAEAIARFPGLKVIYTSGFAETAVRRSSEMLAGTTTLKKPYLRHELAWAVRQTLDGDTKANRETESWHETPGKKAAGRGG